MGGGVMDQFVHYLYDRHENWVIAIERRIDWISLLLFLTYFFGRIPLLHNFKAYSLLTWVFIVVFVTIALLSYVVHRKKIPCVQTITSNLSYAAIVFALFIIE